MLPVIEESMLLDWLISLLGKPEHEDGAPACLGPCPQAEVPEQVHRPFPQEDGVCLS